VRGERSHVRLQDHITNMSKDRFKKGARAIISFALNADAAHDRHTGELVPQAEVLVLERLAGLIPDAERERGINRGLAEWNRAQMVEMLGSLAEDVGLKVIELHPAGTSQVCSKCGALGRRYSIVRDRATHEPAIRFGWVEKLFACPNRRCAWRVNREMGDWEFGYRANSDHNAAVNLHRKLVLGDNALAAYFAWKNQTTKQRDGELEAIDAVLRGPLMRMHGLADDVPF